MATRSTSQSTHVNATDTDTIDDIPDLPSELPEDAPINGSNSNVDVTNMTNASHALSSTDLEGMTFDSLEKRDEINRAKLDPPTGDWEKDDRWKFDSRVQSDNQEPGDINSQGRTVFSVMGKPKPRKVGDNVYEPTLFIRVSPDIRYKDDGVTFDSAHKLWLKVRDMHLALHDRKLSTPAQLKSMLEEDAYIVRTMKGDNGPIVVDVKAKRERR